MFEIPRDILQMPSVKVVGLTVAEVKALSDVQLLNLLNGESEHEGVVPLPLMQVINAELSERALARARVPHWSVLPSFWLLVISVLLAVVAVVAGVLALPQVQQRVFGAPLSQPAALPVAGVRQGSQPAPLPSAASQVGKQ
jgi:hypothetical protein